jgi:hypothetical protein
MKLNDPEYRWYHKDEMLTIMPYYTKRKQLGILSLDYAELRVENDSKIIVKTCHDLNWDKFEWLVNRIPNNLDKNKKKEALQPIDRLHFERRDKGVCLICGSTYHYGSCNVYLYTGTNYKLSHLHHIIPNGVISDENITTLCTHCHQMVHQAMYIAGKWKYGRPL